MKKTLFITALFALMASAWAHHTDEHTAEQIEAALTKVMNTIGQHVQAGNNGGYEPLPVDKVYNPDGTINKDSNNDGKWVDSNITATRLDMKKGQVLLTIDDGPYPAATPTILALLKEYNIRAVFFVVGKQAKANPEIMEQIANDGHIIASHSWAHELDFKEESDLITSIEKTDAEISQYFETSGTKRRYIRTPGGNWNAWRKNTINGDTQAREYIGPFYWDIGGGPNIGNPNNLRQAADWACFGSDGYSSEQCATGYYNDLLNKGKGVILMHDVKAKSAKMLELLLGKMKKEGITNDGDEDGFWTFMDLDQNTAIDHLEVNQVNPKP